MAPALEHAAPASSNPTEEAAITRAQCFHLSEESPAAAARALRVIDVDIVIVRVQRLLHKRLVHANT